MKPQYENLLFFVCCSHLEWMEKKSFGVFSVGWLKRWAGLEGAKPEREES